MNSDHPPDGAAVNGAADTGTAPAVPLSEVTDLVQQIVKSARAHQIYDVANPVYQRFMANLRETFAGMWSRVGQLHFDLTDDSMIWEGHRIAPGEGKENLAFLFFRDGVRSVTFLPGFEDEVTPFLDVVHRGARARARTRT